jgi:hypothetical protein
MSRDERPADFLVPLAGYAALFAAGVALGITLCRFWP